MKKYYALIIILIFNLNVHANLLYKDLNGVSLFLDTLSYLQGCNDHCQLFKDLKDMEEKNTKKWDGFKNEAFYINLTRSDLIKGIIGIKQGQKAIKLGLKQCESKDNKIIRECSKNYLKGSLFLLNLKYKLKTKFSSYTIQYGIAKHPTKMKSYVDKMKEFESEIDQILLKARRSYSQYSIKTLQAKILSGKIPPGTIEMCLYMDLDIKNFVRKYNGVLVVKPNVDRLHYYLQKFQVTCHIPHPIVSQLQNSGYLYELPSLFKAHLDSVDHLCSRYKNKDVNKRRKAFKNINMCNSGKINKKEFNKLSRYFTDDDLHMSYKLIQDRKAYRKKLNEE